MGVDGVRQLAEALKVNQVSGSERNGVQHLQALAFSQTLTTLNLGNNDIGDDATRKLAEALKVNQVSGSEWNGV